MDAKDLLIKLDKIANDVLRLTYEETFKAIYETTYKNVKLTEQTQKKNIQYIAELQKEMNFYYEDLRDFDTKPRDDWNTLLENLVLTISRSSNSRIFNCVVKKIKAEVVVNYLCLFVLN